MSVPTTAADLYGICGFIGSGKSEAALGLTVDDGGVIHHFAGALKDGVATIFGWDRDMLDGLTRTSREWRERPDPYWSEVFDRPFTPRYAMQHLATDLFRAWEPDFWLAAAARKIPTDCDVPQIFPDTRFVNEMMWIRQSHGVVIWVYRAGACPYPIHEKNTIAQHVGSATDLKRHNVFSHIGMGFHPSEREFLAGGSRLIDVVVNNQYDVATLHAMMQHLYLLRDSSDLPGRKHTLYLSYHGTNQFRWEWINRNEEYVVYYVKDNPHATL